MDDTHARAFPLEWPDDIKRTDGFEDHGPMVTMSSSVVALKDLLTLWASEEGAKLSDVVISSNVTIGQALPADPAVAIYFLWNGTERALASDIYRRPEQNVRAIYDQIIDLRRGS